MKNLFLKIGTFREAVSNVMFGKELNLNKWLKNILTYFNVPFYDECCPVVPKPVRYNDGVFEQFDGTSWTPITNPTNKFFGSFHSLQNQTGLSNTILDMKCEITDSWNNGVFLDGLTNYRIVNPGVYNIAFSGQFVKEDGNSSTHIFIWLAQNGVPIPNTNSQLSFPSNSTYVVGAWNFFFETTVPNEYVTLQWKIVSNVDNAVVLEKNTSVSPSIPSLIVTINQVN